MLEIPSRRDEVGDRLAFHEFLNIDCARMPDPIAYAENFMFDHRKDCDWCAKAKAIFHFSFGILTSVAMGVAVCLLHLPDFLSLPGGSSSCHLASLGAVVRLLGPCLSPGWHADAWPGVWSAAYSGARVSCAYLGFSSRLVPLARC